MFWSSHKHYNLQYVIYFSFEDLLALPHLLVLAKSFPFSLLQALFPGYIKEKFFSMKFPIFLTFRSLLYNP